MRSRNTYRRWTDAESQKLQNLWEQYKAFADRYERMAAELPGRTVAGLRIRAHGMGLLVRCEDGPHMSLRQASEYLGRDGDRASHWLTKNAFVQIPRHPNSAPHTITLDQLWSWMEDMRSWNLWKAEELTDEAARAHFCPLRAGWLRPDEAAPILHVTQATITRWVDEGRLAAVRYEKKAIWISRTELEAFRLRYNDDTLRELAEMRSELRWLRQQFERSGIAAPGYPARLPRINEEATHAVNSRPAGVRRAGNG